MIKNYHTSDYANKRWDNLEAEAAFVVLARASALAKSGRSIINLGIGQPDFPTPHHIVAAGTAALERGEHGYTPAPGLDALRGAVCHHIARRYRVSVDSDQVIIFPGGKVTMSFAMLLLADQNAQVIIPDPGFPTYGVMARFAGASVKTYPIRADMNFSMRASDIIAQLTPHTRLLVLNAPGNPTGGMHDPEQLDILVKALADFPDLYILSDEIYSQLCFNDRFRSLLTFPEIQDKLILLDGWSKAYAMTGWRLGWSVWPKHLVEPATNLAIHMHSCVNASAQFAGIQALDGDQTAVTQMCDTFRQRRDMVYAGLNAIPGIRCALPGGAFYAFPDISALGVSGQQAQHELLEDFGVVTIAGTSFGTLATGNIRISFAASDAQLAEALDRIARWASQYRDNVS